MKNLFTAVLLMVTAFSFSQTYIKVNAPTTLVGAPQVGIETSLGKKFTFQGDVLGSYWESINGGPFKLLMVTSELRYHFKEKYKGFYVGGHIAGAIYKIQKWDYWNTNYYQDGESFFLGVTVGYQIKLSDRWLMDIFVGGGNQQSHYTGKYIDTDKPYKQSHYNKSGEWLPYRGGIMFSYKL